MTAILAVTEPDRVTIMSDSATTAADKSGRVVELESKLYVVVGGRAVIATMGEVLLPFFLDWLVAAGRPFRDVADVWARLGDELATYHRSVTPISQESWDTFRGVLVTFDDRPRMGVFRGPISQGDLRVGPTEAFKLYDVADHVEQGDLLSGWMRGWGPSPPEACPVEFRDWALARCSGRAVPFDPHKHGGPMFDTWRRFPVKAGFYGIGGEVSAITLTRDGGFDMALVRQWRDTIGSAIKPEAA